jgi:hypothetical protein
VPSYGNSLTFYFKHEIGCVVIRVVVKNCLGFGVGGDESDPDEEEEDSTLKCSGTAWSGSDSAPHHRSSSTSDLSSSASSTGDPGHSRHKPCRPTEGVLPVFPQCLGSLTVLMWQSIADIFNKCCRKFLIDQINFFIFIFLEFYSWSPCFMPLKFSSADRWHWASHEPRPKYW